MLRIRSRVTLSLHPYRSQALLRLALGTSYTSSTRLNTLQRPLLAHTMARDAETASFRFNHTMYRIKDPQVSLKFYQEILGMELIDTMEGGDFTLFFLAFDHSNGTEAADVKRTKRFAREGVLELTWNHGTESDASFAGYSNGNKDPGRGYGHIAITVDDVEAACARFEKLGVKFQKRLTDGRMKEIAFILDPDGYWIEILPSTYKG